MTTAAPTVLDRLRDSLERARDNAPEVGIDVSAVAAVSAKPPKPIPVVPAPHTETEKEREP